MIHMRHIKAMLIQFVSHVTICKAAKRALTLVTVLMAATFLYSDGHQAWATSAQKVFQRHTGVRTDDQTAAQFLNNKNLLHAYMNEVKTAKIEGREPVSPEEFLRYHRAHPNVPVHQLAQAFSLQARIKSFFEGNTDGINGRLGTDENTAVNDEHLAAAKHLLKVLGIQAHEITATDFVSMMRLRTVGMASENRDELRARLEAVRKLMSGHDGGGNFAVHRQALGYGDITPAHINAMVTLNTNTPDIGGGVDEPSDHQLGAIRKLTELNIPINPANMTGITRVLAGYGGGAGLPKAITPALVEALVAVNTHDAPIGIGAIQGLWGRGKVQRALGVRGEVAVTAEHIAAVVGLRGVLVMEGDRIPAGQFVRALRLVTLGFECFDLIHLLAVGKLLSGYGDRGDQDYRTPRAYSEITVDDVRAMVLLNTNRGRRFEVLGFEGELYGMRLEEPSDLLLEAAKGLWRLGDEGFRETFGTAEMMAYYALKQQRADQVYGAPSLRREPTVEQIQAVADVYRVVKGYPVEEDEKETYKREVVWRLRRDGGRIPGALAVVVNARYDWGRNRHEGGHDRLLWVLWTKPGTLLQDDQGHVFPVHQAFAIRQEDVDGSLPYRQEVHSLVTFHGLRRVANPPIGGVTAVTLIDPDQHP